MATDEQYATVLAHFDSARADGTTIACGGRPVDHLGGWFVGPTVLVDTALGMRAVPEEVFSPVTAVSTFRDEGGVGASGMGRENGTEAVREYTHTKAVRVG